MTAANSLSPFSQRRRATSRTMEPASTKRSVPRPHALTVVAARPHSLPRFPHGRRVPVERPALFGCLSFQPQPAAPKMRALGVSLGVSAKRVLCPRPAATRAP
eukprot:scaffold20544_cov31-Tisochrysis_lutea.AAC.5